MSFPSWPTPLKRSFSLINWYSLAPEWICEWIVRGYGTEAEHHCPGPPSAELTVLSMPLGKTAHPQGPLGLSKGFPVANQGLLGTQVQTLRCRLAKVLPAPSSFPKPHYKVCVSVQKGRVAWAWSQTAWSGTLSTLILVMWPCTKYPVTQFFHPQNGRTSVIRAAPGSYEVPSDSVPVTLAALLSTHWTIRSGAFTPSGTFPWVGPVLPTLLLPALSTEGQGVSDVEHSCHWGFWGRCLRANLHTN